MRPVSNIIAAALACATAGGLATAAPSNIRIAVQLVEVPHPALTGLLAGKASSGDKLHSQAMALVREDTAKLLETCILTCPDRQKATIESIREVIYHTEYEPGGLGSSPAPQFDPNRPVIPSARPEFFFAWETRNVGVTFEVEPTLAHDGKIIDLRLVPEIVDLAGLVTWMEYVDRWGDCSARMPTFYTLRTNTHIALAPGTFELAAVLTPQPTAPAPAALRKILVFARADIVRQRSR